MIFILLALLSFCSIYPGDNVLSAFKTAWQKNDLELIKPYWGFKEHEYNAYLKNRDAFIQKYVAQPESIEISPQVAQLLPQTIKYNDCMFAGFLLESADASTPVSSYLIDAQSVTMVTILLKHKAVISSPTHLLQRAMNPHYQTDLVQFYINKGAL